MRLKTYGIGICFALFLFAGCNHDGSHGGPKGGIRATSDVEISGVITKSAGGEYSMVDLNEIEADDNDLKRPVALGEIINTRHTLLVKVKQAMGSRYSVLLGAPDGSIEKAKAEFLSGSIRASLSCGWIYLTGDRPKLATRWVDAGACGCEIALEIRSSDTPPVHRFFFLGGATATVDTPPTTIPQRDFTAATPFVDVFVDITEKGDIGPTTPVAGHPTAEPFVVELRKMATAAGI